MTDNIHSIGFNPASVSNNGTPYSKPEQKEPKEEAEVQETTAENKSVTPDDVFSYLSQSAAITRAAIEPKPAVQTPVGIAAGEMFDELAPKYADRAKEVGQGGGYTRVLKTTIRRGDNAQLAIVELI